MVCSLPLYRFYSGLFSAYRHRMCVFCALFLFSTCVRQSHFFRPHLNCFFFFLNCHSVITFASWKTVGIILTRSHILPPLVHRIS
uniref:Putative secreted protein n=1 Tax=Amblyomma triste TaxID=251400 RepID=A0A023G1G1_AMBTT